MSRVLKYRLNDGSLVTRSGTESPFTIAPLDSELTKVEIVVEDKGVNSTLSNTMYGTPEETNLVPLLPVITSYSGHEDEGIVISFTLPDGGLPYDDLQVRLRLTSGHPDVPLSTLPAQRVNLERINGKIVGGTFTLMQGDGAGLGTVNTPGEYTISGGYEFYVNSEVRLRLRGVINGNNTPRTDVYIDIEGETLAPPHIIISTRKTWQPERPGSGNWFDIYTNSTGFVKVGNTYRWFYERREYGKKRNTENNGEIQFHEFIDSTTPTDPNSWSSPQQMTYSFPPGVRFNRTATPDNNHYDHEGGLEVIIPDPTTPGRLVGLGKVVGDTFSRTAGKFISTNGGLHWEYIGNAFEGAVTDGNLSLMFDTPNNRWVVYNRARGPASNSVGRWNHSGMPTGTDSNGNRIGRSISRTDRRGVVKIQSNTPDFTNNTLWQPATDGINGTYLILDPASVFNYEDPNNQTLIQTNTTGLHGFPSDRPTRFQYNINSITRKELFDFYHGTAFYDEDLKVYRLFFAVQHRTDERWGAQKVLWVEGDRENNKPFDFTNDLFDQRQYASRLDTEANWRPSGAPFFQVEMRSTDGTNFTFLKDGREEDGLLPSAFNISHIRRQMIPPAPYTQAQYFAGYSPSVVPEPPMMSFASTFLDYNGKKYLALFDSGRAYRHIPDRRQGTEQNPVITSNLILVEIGPASGEDPDPELPAPTITSVTGGINSLIVNGTTNIVSGPEPPSVPSNFRTVETTTSSVTLAWNSVSNADFYEVFRGGSLLTQTSGLEYQDTNLSANTTYSYTVRAFNDGGYSNFSSALIATTLEEETSPPDDNWEEPVFYHGWWDHRIDKNKSLPSNLVPYVNVGKSMERNITSIANHGVSVIAQLGKVKGSTQQERISRLSNLESGHLAQHDAHIPIIHFVDEPLAGGVEADDLDALVAHARNIYGDKYKYAYTINSGELYYPQERAVSDYAQDFDYVFHQTYPYRNQGGSRYLRSIGPTRGELRDSLDLRLQTLKQKIPKSKYFIVAQAFFGGKYDPPPTDAPLWFMEWCLENTEDIHGLLLWKYFDSKSWTAAENMPDYLENIKLAHSMIPQE